MFHLTSQQDYKLLEGRSCVLASETQQKTIRANSLFSQMSDLPLPTPTINPFHPPNLMREEILDRLNNNCTTTIHMRHLQYLGTGGALVGSNRQESLLSWVL